MHRVRHMYLAKIVLARSAFRKPEPRIFHGNVILPPSPFLFPTRSCPVGFLAALDQRQQKAVATERRPIEWKTRDESRKGRTFTDVSRAKSARNFGGVHNGATPAENGGQGRVGCRGCARLRRSIFHFSLGNLRPRAPPTHRPSAPRVRAATAPFSTLRLLPLLSRPRRSSASLAPAVLAPSTPRVCIMFSLVSLLSPSPLFPPALRQPSLVFLLRAPMTLRHRVAAVRDALGSALSRSIAGSSCSRTWFFAKRHQVDRAGRKRQDVILLDRIALD